MAKRIQQKYRKTFFVIAVYNIGVPFSYVYLDEGNNPIVHQTDIDRKSGKMSFESLNTKLSAYINNLIEELNKNSVPA
ncbi:MAG: hypothetical protein V4497_02080 [Bacteroidota bacterium]